MIFLSFFRAFFVFVEQVRENCCSYDFCFDGFFTQIDFFLHHKDLSKEVLKKVKIIEIREEFSDKLSEFSQRKLIDD